MLTYFHVAQAFVCAHPYAVSLGAVFILSLLNKALPGHPAARGYIRTILDVVLACSPMPGAKSWLFAALAAKVGDNAAGQLLDWLSRFLNVPLVPSVPASDKPALEVLPPPRGFVSVRVLLLLGTAALLLGCGFIRKNLGPDFGKQELDCGKAAVHSFVDQFLPQLAVILATATNQGLEDALAQFEDDALKAAGSVAKDGLACAAQVLVADYQAMHPKAPQSPAELSSEPDPDFIGYVRAQRYYDAKMAEYSAPQPP